MDINVIRDLNSKLKGFQMSDLQALSQLGTATMDDWSDMMTDIEPLCDLSRVLLIDYPNHVVLESDSTTYFADLASNSRQLNLSDGTTVHHLKVVNSSGVLYVSLDDVELFVINVSNSWAGKPYEYDQQSALLFNGLLAGLTRKAGVMRALADIAINAGSAAWDNLTATVSSLTAIINRYSVVLADYAVSLLGLLTSGPKALLSALMELIDSANTQYVDEDLSYLLSSTSIVVNQFAWGVVASTIGAVVTAVGAAVACFSRIAGFIVAGVGIGIQIVTRVVVSATTAWDSTQYSIQSGSDVCHCFSFVVEQGTYNSLGVANSMRAKGWTTQTVFVPHQGAVYLMYLKQPSDPTSDEIVFEVHLTTDVDLSERIFFVNVPDGQSYLPVVKVDMGDTDSKPSCYSILPYQTTSNTFRIPFSVAKIYGTAGTTMLSPYYGIRQKDWAGDCISPIDFSLIDTVTQWFSGNFQEYIDIRLCSALILFTGARLSALAGLYRTYNNYNDLSFAFFEMENASYTEYTTSGLSMLATVYRLAWNCFATVPGSITTTVDMRKTSFGLSSTQRDSLITAISTCFNALAYSSAVTTSNLDVYTGSLIGRDGQMKRADDSYYTLTTSSLANVLAPGYRITSSESSASDRANLMTHSGVWSRHMAISLPTLTFSGFLAGLIVDGLIGIALTVATVFLVTRYMKVLNKRAQLQARTEAAWYEYQDNPTNENWKAYKSTRFRYNLLAIATGGTMLSMGLYDDGSSVGDIISSVFDSSEESTQDISDRLDTSDQLLTDHVTDSDAAVKDYIRVLITGQ